MISKSKITGCLPEKYKNISISVFEAVDSTNRVAKESVGELPHLVVADSQTAGRGRLGRSFYSPAGTGIYMSLAVGGFPSFADGVFTTSAAAVAVTDAILSLTGINTGIKWVNDIYLDGKKICGILAESVVRESDVTIVIGIGLNLTTKDFPGELTNIAGSLSSDVPKELFVAEIVKNLLEFCQNPDDGTFMDRYRSRSIVIGKEINYFHAGEQKSATAVDIDNSGGLIIRDSSGIETTLSSGEITIRLK